MKIGIATAMASERSQIERILEERESVVANGRRFCTGRIGRNEVVLGTREEAHVSEFRVDNMNWMAAGPTRGMISAFVKIRSTGAPLGPVEFEDGLCRAPGEGLFGVAPGQSAVFYDAEGTILCGGVIRPR